MKFLNIIPLERRCAIDVQSFGRGDDVTAGWIRLNGHVVLAASRHDGSDPGVFFRGVGLVTIRKDCSLRSSQYFDTSGDENASARLVKFIKNIKDKTGLVVVGMSAYGIHLTPQAAASIRDIGVTSSSLQNAAVLAFITNIGENSFLKQDIKTNKKKSAMVRTGIFSTYLRIWS